MEQFYRIPLSPPERLSSSDDEEYCYLIEGKRVLRYDYRLEQKEFLFPVPVREMITSDRFWDEGKRKTLFLMLSKTGELVLQEGYQEGPCLTLPFSTPIKLCRKYNYHSLILITETGLLYYYEGDFSMNCFLLQFYRSPSQAQWLLEKSIKGVSALQEHTYHHTKLQFLGQGSEWLYSPETKDPSKREWLTHPLLPPLKKVWADYTAQFFLDQQGSCWETNEGDFSFNELTGPLEKLPLPPLRTLIRYKPLTIALTEEGELYLHAEHDEGEWANHPRKWSLIKAPAFFSEVKIVRHGSDKDDCHKVRVYAFSLEGKLYTGKLIEYGYYNTNTYTIPAQVEVEWFLRV